MTVERLAGGLGSELALQQIREGGVCLQSQIFGRLQ